ncbi:MAG: hypothetical protein K2L00_05770, partial [Muribaculaceae bacterium]|nr:hypothetical protein [Muribaculaceae bacterium]
PDTGAIEIIINPIEVTVGTEKGETKPTVIKGDEIKGFDQMAQSIADNIQEALSDVIDDLNDQLQKNVLDQIKQQVEDMIASMNEEINGKIDNIFDDLVSKTDPWFKRLNKLVDLYNKVANKVNNVLEDPNHYLQVAMFYNQADSKFGMISNKKGDPTIFKGAKGNVGLYASSYTAELVAPAFKKFVAVSNVYNADGSNMDATAAEALVKKANQGNFNKVMDGYTVRYSLPVSNLEKNKIYEIVYQGLDFHGVTSTQKFYITVK